MYRELYETQVDEADQAKRILAAEAEGEHVSVRWADDAMWPRPRPATPPHAPRHCGHPSRLPGLHRREERPRCRPNGLAYYRTDGHCRRSSRPNGPLFGGLLERKNVVETHVTEIAPDIYSMTTYNADA